MRRLDSRDILRIWEAGQGQLPHQRALTLLAVADPEHTREQGESMALGRRNGALLALHRLSFGPELAAFAACPHCAERLELAIAIPSDAPRLPEVQDEAFEVTDGDLTWRFRLPCTADLAAVAAEQPDPAAARDFLARRCLVAGPRPVAAAAALAEGIVAMLCREIDARDPMAAMTVDLQCPACGHIWDAALDLGAFLWAKVSAQAKRLLREVDALARAYGWSEAEILDLSPWRRQCYLELAGA